MLLNTLDQIISRVQRVNNTGKALGLKTQSHLKRFENQTFSGFVELGEIFFHQFYVKMFFFTAKYAMNRKLELFRSCQLSSHNRASATVA